MNRNLGPVLALVILLLVAAGGFGLGVRNFRECRAFGHSWLYCFSAGSR
jgi:hypothetical protein